MFKNILIRKQIKNTVWILKVTILVSSEFYVIIKGSPAALCQLLEMLVGSKFQLFKICLVVQSVHQGGPFPQPSFYHTAPRIVWINHICGRRAARVKTSAYEVESLPQSPSQMLCPVVHHQLCGALMSTLLSEFSDLGKADSSERMKAEYAI